MQNFDKIISQMKEEEGFDVKQFIFRLLQRWYWFVLFGIVGIFAGYFFTRVKTPTFEINASVLIKDQDKGMSVDKIFGALNLDNKTNIENHILMLSSYALNYQTVQSLNLDIAWFRKGILQDQELYKNLPYVINLDTDSKNLDGIKVRIVPTSKSAYSIIAKGSFDGKDFEGIKEIKVNLKGDGFFGKPFKSKYFNFTITKNNNFVPEENDEQYYFIMHDRSDMTKSYLERLHVTLANKNADGIFLRLEDRIPHRGVDYLNALTGAYLKYGLTEKNRTSENTVRFIDNQIQGVVDSLKIAGHLFTEFRSEKGIVDLSEESKQVIERMKDLQIEKELSHRKIEYFKSLQSYMNDSDQMKSIAAPSVLGIEDAGLNALVIKLGELYNKRSSMAYVVKDENPALRMIDNEINGCLASLEENIKNLLRNTTIELRNIDSQLKGIEGRLSDLPKTEQQLINIKRSFDLNNELYTFLLQKRAEAAITTASNVADANVMDSARLDTVEKTGPSTLIYLIVGMILGMVIPFIFIILKDYLDDTIKNREELERLCKLPIAAEIVRNRYNEEIPVFRYPRSGIAEAFRTLRVNIQYLSGSIDAKVIGIHSMIPGEGKTFVALNLASILALNNKKVLLVGCDLRKPKLHNVFKSENIKGLSTFLIDKHFYREIINKTDQDKLFYTNSGVIPPNPSELIGNGKFTSFIEQAKNDFDYIILDNAPVSLVVDGFLIGEYADLNLLVLRQGYSHNKQIAMVNQLKKDKKFKNPAVILNGIVSKNYSYLNKNKSGYHNGYYEDENKEGIWKKLFKHTA